MKNTFWKSLEKDRNFFLKLKDSFLQKITLQVEEISKQYGWGIPPEDELKKALTQIYEDIFFKPFNKEIFKEDLKKFFETLKGFNQEILYILSNSIVQILFEYAEYILEQKRWEELVNLFRLGEEVVSALREFKEGVFSLLRENFEKEIENLINIILSKYHIDDISIIKSVIVDVIKRKFGEKLQLQAMQNKIQDVINKTIKKEKEIQQNEQNNLEEIYKLLNLIKESNKPEVELRVYYRGIPIDCIATLKNIEPKTNQVQLENKNCKYLLFYQPETQIFINHPLLPKPLLGKVFKGEPKKGSILLKPLNFCEDPCKKRNILRIELDRPIPVKVYKGLKIYKGFIKDISPKGMGIVFPEKVPSVDIGNLVKIRAKLDNLDLDTFAVVRNIDVNRRKIGVEYNLPYDLEKKLLQFLFKEQKRILSTLKGVDESGEI